MVVNGANIETKHRPIDGSNELMDAIFPMPKKEPKLNNNFKIDLIRFKILIYNYKYLYLQKRMHISIGSKKIYLSQQIE